MSVSTIGRRQALGIGAAALAALHAEPAYAEGRRAPSANAARSSESDGAGAAALLERRLAGFDRVALVDGPTPLQRLQRLERALGPTRRGISIYAKRDDLGLGAGGNKLRKLEFLIGQAKAQGCDTFVTVGTMQSNHTRLSAAAAAISGMACELVMTENAARGDVDYLANGNIVLDTLFGAKIHRIPEGADALAFARVRGDELTRSGHRAYVVRSGGSTPIGSLGYAVCAGEILSQETVGGMAFDRIFLPNGGAGTHAGLAAGFKALGHNPSRVTSFTVIAHPEKALADTHSLAVSTLNLIEPKLALSPDEIQVDGSQLAPGYGIPTDAMMEALHLLARTEGLLLDPVYSGKAFAGMLAALRRRDVPDGGKILFLMTGGSPALFAYRKRIEED